MIRWRTQLLGLLFLFAVAGCSEKKKILLSGEEPVAIADFITFFTPLTKPLTISDTILTQRFSDSLSISVPVLKNIVPDSILGSLINKKEKPQFHALGSIEVPDAETYTLIRYTSRSKRMVLVLVFDKKSVFQSATTFFYPLPNKDVQQSLLVDRKFLFTLLQLRKNADATISEGKAVYVYNEAAKFFTLIMTDALEDRVKELINPIDTLATMRKYSADYTQGKMNLVSIRDGRKPDRITFFIHFEKVNGDCSGELKGEAFWKSPFKAEYRQAGDPCILQFIFTSQGVRLQERSCGSQRDAGCLFDGSFTRKKSPRIVKKS
ncbi:MAG: hypothetical protein FJY19_01520 [Bacteroidetes bacterium]|nr:hypothetical protein [Bacteroidota bacterium]